MAKITGKKDKAAETTPAKTEKAITVKKSTTDKNFGCAILGLRVNFYPSDEVRVNKVLTKKSYVGKILLIEGMEEGIVKIGVEGIVGVFKCKHEGDKTLNILVDNSWAE